MQQNPYEAPEEVSLRVEDKQLVPWRCVVPAVLLGGLGLSIIFVAIIGGLLIASEMWEMHQAGRLAEFKGFTWPETLLIAAWLVAAVAWLSSAWKCWNQHWRWAVVLAAIGAINGAFALALRN